MSELEEMRKMFDEALDLIKMQQIQLTKYEKENKELKKTLNEIKEILKK